MIDIKNMANTLSSEGCRARQQRLRDQLASRNLDAALLTQMHYVHYFTGHWGRVILRSAVLIPVDGPVVLVTGLPAADYVAADECIEFESNRAASLVEDQGVTLFKALEPQLKNYKSLGGDQCHRQVQTADISDILHEMRRAKDPDEVALIRRALVGWEAAILAARELIEPGITEIEVYARMQAAAIEAIGEPIGEMGNDYQAGSSGSAPRLRPMQAGELIPLDVGVVLRGYHSDATRTFSVDRNPTDVQLQSQQRIVEVFAAIEAAARPGVSCKALWQQASDMLDGFNDCSFSHHLGHGIGLSCHEAPRLNPNWDDTLRVGDVITLEPGMYHEKLVSGIRIEDNYLVTETGLENFCDLPKDL